MERPEVFLASRLTGLEDIRLRISELGRRTGHPIWVSEINAREEFRGHSLDAIQIACLKRVRAAQKFICILDGTFGTTWDQGQISILELEIATAAFSRRDIWLLLLAPFTTPDRRIVSLLNGIRAACPQARILGVLEPPRLLDAIERILEPSGTPDGGFRLGRLVEHIARVRAPVLNVRLNLRDVQFLDRAFVPLLDGPPDEATVASLLADAAQEAVIPVKLAKLWIAIRHLSSAPFVDAEYQRFLPMWFEALAQWSGASAWYALHGHFHLGRLAAVNTLFSIRARMPRPMQVALGPPSILADNGAVASEYYSIAKIVPSWRTRYWLLRKALWNCDAALARQDVADRSGLLDIRGHVKLRMLNPLGGVADLKRALAIRRDAQDMGQIGESEVHLGRAYVACFQYGKAERLLLDGVAKLEQAGHDAFTVQGLRHLGVYYGKVGQRRDAVAVLRKAQDLASRREIAGQLSQIVEELRRLGEPPEADD